VEKHYNDTISLQDVARIACMETKYFSAFFHKRVGVTFTSWMRQVRIDAAMHLLRRFYVDIVVTRKISCLEDKVQTPGWRRGRNTLEQIPKV
jgi:YesN/AraC family two-component response regulator